MKSIEEFFDIQPEPQKSCFLALRSIILEFDRQVSETVKYGMPCFVLDSKPWLYLWKDKKSQEPYILFVDGISLTNPLLESGDRAKMKHFQLNSNEDFPVSIIYELLNEAWAIRAKG
ncbi:DUF1801 domain-containing protein [Algoriphagus sp. PAP.12]|uniref:DUF1801 domain-containing protein n=1 Tax=Algoriphagus sp. PAP.12 TaxID=2996678 RepID=UPI00227B698C|nr:DUF1801 domain-containing protein [Algoriphagus sp. PAP.12]